MMRWMSQRLWVWGVCVGAALLSFGIPAQTATAAEQVLSENRLPGDVLAYFSLTNVKDFRDKWNSTQMGKLLADKELGEFLKQLEKPLNEVSEKIQGETGFGLQQLLAIPTGEVSLAVLQSGNNPISIAIMINYGDHEADVKKLIEKGIKGAEDAGGKKSTEEVEGTQIIVLKGPNAEGESESKDKPKNPAEALKTVAHFHKDSTLVISNTVATLKEILKRWDGKQEKTLANQPSYKLIRKKCSSEKDGTPELLWFLDPIGIVKTAVATFGEGNPSASIVQVSIPMLGLDKLKGVGGSTDLGTSEFDSVGRCFINVEQPPTGIFRLFVMPPVAHAPPKWVHDKVATSISLNWDLQEAYDGAKALVNSVQGEGFFDKMVDQMAENDPKVHLKKDVIDQLSGLLHFATDVFEAKDEDSHERFALAIELKDEASFRKVLAKVIKLIPAKARDFNGETIYEIETGGGMAADDDDSDKKSDGDKKDKDEDKKDGDKKDEDKPGEKKEQSQKDEDKPGDSDKKKEEEDDDDDDAPEIVLSPAFAIGRKSLIIVSDVRMLEQILQAKDEDTLQDSESFKLVSKHFPAKTSSISFQRADSQVKAAYEALRSGKIEQFTGELDIDFSKLPDFETIRKYLTPSGGYIRPDEDGVLMEGFSLKGK